MGNSLQDQLLKAGLVTPHQARQSKSNQRKGRRGDSEETDAKRAAIAAAKAEKAARDRELNRARAQEAQRKAEQSALREMIHQQRLTRANGDLAYNFADGSALKRLYVTTAQHAGIVCGELAIVRQDTFYELIPAATAERIAARDPSLILVWNQGAERPSEDDPYAEYQVPDDLIW